MTLSRFGKNCFGLILGLGLAGSVCAANLDQMVTENLNKVARDMHYSSRAVGNEGQTSDVAMGALAKESAAVDSLRRVLSKVETEKEIQTAAQQLKAFGYRVSTNAEKRAFREGYSILEKRVKFLAQMENPQLLSSLNYLSAINSEVENGFAKLDTDISSRVQLLASKRSSKTRTSTGMLGANVKNGKTYFSVYSWAATDVKVVIFKNASDKKGTAYPMKKRCQRHLEMRS